MGSSVDRHAAFETDAHPAKRSSWLPNNGVAAGPSGDGDSNSYRAICRNSKGLAVYQKADLVRHAERERLDLRNGPINRVAFAEQTVEGNKCQIPALSDRVKC